MKKVTAILTAAIMLFSTFAFASDNDQVSERVKSAFLKDFSNASKVSWEITNDHYFATFTLNQVEAKAAYNAAGDLVGTSRTIESSNLPLNISLALAKKYEGYTVSKIAIELIFEGDTRYYLSIANEKQILKLKCSSMGNFEVERKIRKI